jgi:hypothetical protein
MNAYEKAQALGLTGTDQQIVDKLKPLTAIAIRLDYLLELLNFRGMLRKTDGSGGQERWIGTLQNLKATLVSLGMTDKVAAYEMWFSHITNPRQITWDTRFPDWAESFLAMEQSFAGGQNMPSQDDFDAVVAIGGGMPYKDLTAEQYATQRTTAQIEGDLQAVRELSDTAARTASQQPNATLASIKAAVVVALEA